MAEENVDELLVKIANLVIGNPKIKQADLFEALRQSEELTEEDRPAIEQSHNIFKKMMGIDVKFMDVVKAVIDEKISSDVAQRVQDYYWAKNGQTKRQNVRGWNNLVPSKKSIEEVIKSIKVQDAASIVKKGNSDGNEDPKPEVEGDKGNSDGENDPGPKAGGDNKPESTRILQEFYQKQNKDVDKNFIKGLISVMRKYIADEWRVYKGRKDEEKELLYQVRKDGRVDLAQDWTAITNALNDKMEAINTWGDDFYKKGEEASVKDKLVGRLVERIREGEREKIIEDISVFRESILERYKEAGVYGRGKVNYDIISGEGGIKENVKDFLGEGKKYGDREVLGTLLEKYKDTFEKINDVYEMAKNHMENWESNGSLEKLIGENQARGFDMMKERQFQKLLDKLYDEYIEQTQDGQDKVDKGENDEPENDKPKNEDPGKVIIEELINEYGDTLHKITGTVPDKFMGGDSEGSDEKKGKWSPQPDIIKRGESIIAGIVEGAGNAKNRTVEFIIQDVPSGVKSLYERARDIDLVEIKNRILESAEKMVDRYKRKGALDSDLTILRPDDLNAESEVVDSDSDLTILGLDDLNAESEVGDLGIGSLELGDSNTESLEFVDLDTLKFGDYVELNPLSQSEMNSPEVTSKVEEDSIIVQEGKTGFFKRLFEKIRTSIGRTGGTIKLNKDPGKRTGKEPPIEKDGNDSHR